MLKRKLLSCILVLCLLLSISGAPAVANAIESETATGSSGVNEYTIQPTGDPIPLDSQSSSGDLQVQDSQESAPEDQSSEDISNSDDPLSEDILVNEDPVSEDTPANEDPDGDGVDVNVDTIVDIVAGGISTAISGLSEAIGTVVNNEVSSGLDAVAEEDNGDSSENGAEAINETYNGIKNEATAGAVSGAADAVNFMDENTVNITPEEKETVDVTGNIINSTVVVNILYYYLAILTGEAGAQTGNTSANGLLADNCVNNENAAVADADASHAGDGGATADNETTNEIYNNAVADAYSGTADGKNTMVGNDILIAPIIDTLIQFCGDIINSTVTIDLIYNFMAEITGQANAGSGDASAVGADVSNSINNSSDAVAIGDAPTDGDCLRADGSALAINDTENNIENEAQTAAQSGDAKATNTMLDNDIIIAPTISNTLKLLSPIVDSEVVIRVVYNFWGVIQGIADAQTGDADAVGILADNTINNESGATAVGDTGGTDACDDTGVISGNATGISHVENSIDNEADARADSGNAEAENTMKNNTINLSPVIDTCIMLMRPIIQEGIDGGPVVIEIVFDIWSSLIGSAEALTGNASAKGVVADNLIDSQADAAATASDGSANPSFALDVSNNRISNDASAEASTGDALAKNELSNKTFAVTDCLKQEFIIDELPDSSLDGATIGTDLVQIPIAETGEANALGSDAESEIKTAAVANNTPEGDASNVDNNRIDNRGNGNADTGDVRTDADNDEENAEEAREDDDPSDSYDEGQGDSGPSSGSDESLNEPETNSGSGGSGSSSGSGGGSVSEPSDTEQSPNNSNNKVAEMAMIALALDTLDDAHDIKSIAKQVINKEPVNKSKLTKKIKKKGKKTKLGKKTKIKGKKSKLTKKIKKKGKKTSKVKAKKRMVRSKAVKKTRKLSRR